MKRSFRFALPGIAVAFSFAFAEPAEAIIFFNKDNSANQSDPSTGVPWEAVGKVTNSGASNISGSAVYVGNGWVLTANHVTVNSSYNHVSFDGSTVFEIDLSTVTQVAPNVDLKVAKLKSTPSLSPVTLLTTGSESVTTASTIVGWGKGRDSTDLPGTQTVDWGDDTTIAKRWGLNKLYDSVSISYQSGNYTAIRTILGANDAGSTFNPDGLGDDEAALTLYDSGSSMFQNIVGTWYLIGIGTNVDVNGQSYFSDDSLVSPANDPGHGNYLVRISSYDTQILGLIPEPSVTALLAFGAGIAVLLRFRRQHCDASLLGTLHDSQASKLSPLPGVIKPGLVVGIKRAILRVRRSGLVSFDQFNMVIGE